MTPEERSKYSESMFSQYPEFFPEDRRASILSGVVVLGMTPFEARLAGGAFTYKVVADTTKWPDHSDPFNVMWAQSRQADNSEIWMTFANRAQFPGKGNSSFRVCFEHGRAVEIVKLPAQDGIKNLGEIF